MFEDSEKALNHTIKTVVIHQLNHIVVEMTVVPLTSHGLPLAMSTDLAVLDIIYTCIVWASHKYDLVDTIRVS